MMAVRSHTLRALLATATLLALACGPRPFDPASKVSSVRVFASRAEGDKAYAKPGDTVTLSVLSYDGRAERPEPLVVYWIPFVCVNPRNDLYYACFAPSPGANAGAGGAGGGGIGSLPVGTPLVGLPTGPQFQAKIPDDIIATHPPVEGASAPYGLAIVFNVACAGHLEIVAPSSAGPQQVPIGCFDKNGNRLGANDYVIGFTRIYAYADRTNANPIVTKVTQDGNEIPEAGLSLPLCKGDCAEVSLNVDVPPESQEVQAGDLDPDGQPRKEQIWAAYYATDGDLDGDARLLYDPRAGRITSGNDLKFKPPKEPPLDPSRSFLWVIVHDNRDGVTWRQIPLSFH